MTNYEKYKDKIIDAVSKSNLFAVGKDGKISSCGDITCNNCIFFSYDKRELMWCHINAKKWLNAEYVKPGVKASTLAVDTKVICWDDGHSSCKRHFAGFKNGKMYAFIDGKTSWNDYNSDETNWENYETNWKNMTLEDGTPVIPE